jgi:hypothetical protein
MKLLPVAIGRYRATVEDLGNSGIEMQRARETLREMLGTHPAKAGRRWRPNSRIGPKPSVPGSCWGVPYRLGSGGSIRYLLAAIPRANRSR